MNIFLLLLFLNLGFSQTPIDVLLKKTNSKTVNYITVDELKLKNDCMLLDTREANEYNVSHIKNAISVGYYKFKISNILKQFKTKDALIIVYCSLGVRSEDIGEKLIKAGYTNVYNLYGGIFEWKNKDNIVVDNENKTTEKVHAFSKEWSKYLTKGEKVY